MCIFWIVFYFQKLWPNNTKRAIKIIQNHNLSKPSSNIFITCLSNFCINRYSKKTKPIFNILEKTKISITGADISPSINNNPVKLNIVHNINKGDLLSFGKLKYGIRSYLSVLGGFLTKEVMGSKSMYPNITKSFRIANGDFLKIKTDQHEHITYRYIKTNI